MLLTLVRKEMLSQVLNVRFYVSFALAFLLLVPATYILATDYGLMQREYGPLIGKGFYTPGGWDRFWVCREIPRLRVLASGLDENLSLRSHNTVYEGAYFGESQFVHNFLSDILSHLDFVFFINIVMSVGLKGLLGIFLDYRIATLIMCKAGNMNIISFPGHGHR